MVVQQSYVNYCNMAGCDAFYQFKSKSCGDTLPCKRGVVG